MAYDTERGSIQDQERYGIEIIACATALVVRDKARPSIDQNDGRS
jgi:hypothetical protein